MLISKNLLLVQIQRNKKRNSRIINYFVPTTNYGTPELEAAVPGVSSYFNEDIVWHYTRKFGTVGRPENRTSNNHSIPDFWNSNNLDSLILIILYFVYLVLSYLLNYILIINFKFLKCNIEPKIGTIFND